MKTVHFTLGPVQGFVAQARRTRDLYAGSFLLSYLAGWAIRAVREAGGKVEFPAVTDEAGGVRDPLFAAICSVAEGQPVIGKPSLGTLPNRLRATVEDSFDPEACRTAVQKAWYRVAGEVWRTFLEPVAHTGQGVRGIWDRQVENFWDMNWVVGEDGSLLDRRKNWRSFVPNTEPGDKCTVMGTMQELSGYIRSHGKEERREQDGFWQIVRENSVRCGAGALDLRKDERLCAIAMVKRLYPRVAEKAIGWTVPVNYPSTPYIAAVPWIKSTVEKEPGTAPRFVALAESISAKAAVGESLFPDLAAARHRSGGALADLDGNCYFRNALENDRLWPEGTASVRRTMAEMLPSLNPEPAGPFCAMLLMDGDRLGALLGRLEGEGRRVSRALARFSERVAEIVRKNNGVNVYAGGDDVLALFPLRYALNAAWQLRAAYGAAFRDEFGMASLGGDDGRVSAAILFAHYHLSLKRVLTEAHRLLDDVAKEQSGRDSLAIEVWKGSGRVLTWFSPWDALRDAEPDLLSELVHRFSGAGKQEKELNSTFFYNARTLFGLLGDSPLWNDKKHQEDLLAAEYLKNRERTVTAAEARQRVDRLLRLCRRSWRDRNGLHVAEGPLSFDGAMLVRFLAEGGITE